MAKTQITANGPAAVHPREFIYLPQEYDSYWAAWLNPQSWPTFNPADGISPVDPATAACDCPTVPA